MSTPLPELPANAESFTAFSFGGYATQPVGLVGESFWPRAGARLIDQILLYGVTYAAGYSFRLMLIAASGGQVPHWVAIKLRHLGATGWAMGVLSWFVYHVVCTSVHGSTLGKRLLSLVVVQEDGTPCRIKSALVRELGYFVDSLFFGLIGYFAMQKNFKEQRYGDQWADTLVCQRAALPRDQLRGDGRFLLGLMLGTMATAAAVLVGLLIAING